MSEKAILVLDDDPVMRALLREILREDGWDLIPCSDPGEALRLAQERCPAAVIFDFRLEQMDGSTFYAALRDGGIGCPAILCSGWGEVRDIAASLGVPFVPKPFDIDVLLSAVSNAVGGRPTAMPEALPKG